MPVLLQSKYDNPQSPTSIPATPVRSSLGRLTSATTSYSPTVTNGSQAQKLNVVTRVAIEGKTKKDPGGASVRMYLKISVPLDSPHVSPGATIPLFPEENVKVLSSQVHPLDQNGAPYSFAASSSPLLYSAARALNMPARSQETFESAFRLPKTNSHSSVLHTSKPETLDGTPPVDIQYTGQILVSGYSVAFVLPKVFLPSRRHREGSHSDFEDDPPPLQTPPSRRRPSIGERNQAQFMAAIDMWVPFITKPTRSPYLLAIPTPRCLHNQIKLRIFPPANTSASMASLSSVEDDGNAWDLTSDPHVTRSASARPSRANSYSHFADDESSDSSTTGTSDACIVQGTFPSAERIRIRWAKPHKLLNHPGVEQDGRRRVGVDDVSGEVICNIRGKGTSASNPDVEGVLMHVEYKGQCKGVWFPGVATLLGLDVSLEAKNSEISWPQGYPSQWEISGSAGYTGFDTGSPRSLTGGPSRTPSSGTDGHLQSPSDEGQPQHPNASLLSTSSLLRAPLPSQNLPDYSFEAGNASASLSPAGTLSSLSSSLPTSSTPNLPSDPQHNTPGSPITLHLNMNELPMSAKPIFTFSIAGTILVTARSSQTRPNVSLTSANQKYGEPDPVVLPRFTVLAAHTESTSLVVRNEFDGGSVEVFRPTGDIFNDPQTRKTVLHRNGSTKCGEEGARIALKYFDTLGVNGYPSTPRSRTPSTNGAGSPMTRPILPARGKREGPPMISSLSASVTFLKGEKYSFPTEYAVHVVLSSPAQADPEWLEFGFACLDNLGSSSSRKCGSPSRVRVICASLDGVPVKTELSSVPKSHKDQAAAPFERLSSKEWLHWGKVFTGTSVGGTVVIDYIVETSLANSSGKNLLKGSAIDLQVLFPTFFMGVSRFEVILDPIPGFHSVPLQSNFHYYHGDNDSSRLLQYSLDPSEKSILTVKMSKAATPRSPLLSLCKAAFVLTWISLVVAVVWMYQINSRPLEEIAAVSISETWPESPTITVTTTVHATTTIKWRDDAPESTTSSISTSSSNPASTSSVLYTAPTSASTLTPTEAAISVRPPLAFFDGFSLSSLSQAFNFSLSEKHVEAMKTAMAQAVHTLEIVWHLFRKVYHYPLDPP